ncbi:MULTISPECIES: ATP-dependent DNA ligase [Sphingomonas]|uniref:ATP-dependent DNA ligase n=1 Tax=Sphingomonas TaxID=13687 RepID=UPI000DEF7F52|nr:MULTISPECIES: ATP-dependent DNA ligase [Sphingomonas]
MSETAPFAPMEALLASELPDGPGWLFEPKWDGFRCLAVREGDAVALWSKSGKPLGRYFPEVVASLATLPARRFILDGELIIESGGEFSFAALQQRLHPAESRVRKLAAETPARLMAFDLLGLAGKNLASEPLAKRRAKLQKFVADQGSPDLLLSPATERRADALGWLALSGAALDGVIAKRQDEPYRPGERAFVKVKQRRSADCVVGGYRTERASATMASLLLGLYDDEGKLNHVGFCSSFSAAERAEWTPELEKLAGGTGFTGAAPGGPSRWANARSAEWIPLKPKLVVEVAYDQVTGGRFRHGTRLLRRRPDKRPDQCRCDQLRHALSPAELGQLLGR